MRPAPAYRSCPRCEVPLTPSPRGELALDECGRCGGVWLDRGELERVVEAPAQRWPEGDGATPVKRAYVPCPVCGALMTPRVFEGQSGVVLDWCGRHGVWADPGELETARRWVAGGGLQRKALRDAEHARLAERLRRGTVARSAGVDDRHDWVDLLIALF